MAALLSSEIGNTDKLPVFVAEAQEMGIEVLPPNVNDSEVRFKPVGPAKGGTSNSIRYGLAGVKNVGVGAVQALIKEREANGPYEGLIDFCSRVDTQLVNKRTIESLIKCGALDFCKMSRGRMFAGLDFALSRAASTQRDRKSGQALLFAALAPAGDPSGSANDLPMADPWPESQMLAAERELLGFYISGHPLTAFEWALKLYNLPDSKTLDKLQTGTMVRLGGLVSQYQKRFTKKTQEPMGVFRLEHLDGVVEVIAFPDAFREYGVYLSDAAPVMVCGEFTREDEQTRIKASEIYPLKDVHRHFTDRVSIHVPAANLDEARLLKIKELVASNPGNTPLTICLQFPTGEKVFVDTARTFTVEISEKLVKDIEHAVGEDGIYIAVSKRACRKNGQQKAKPWLARAQEQ